MNNLTPQHDSVDTTPIDNYNDSDTVSTMQDNASNVEPPKQHSTKSNIVKAIILIVFFALIIYAVLQITSQFSQGDTASLGEVLSHINYSYLVLLLIVVALLLFTDTLKYSIVNKMTYGKYQYMFCFNLNIMGKFYDNITPFNTGGQPYQIYMLRKNGHSGSSATAVPIIKYIVDLAVWILVSLVLYIVNNSALDLLSSGEAITMKVVTYVGIGIATLMPISVILFSLMPRVTMSVVGFFYRLLAKMRIIKNTDKLKAKTLEFLNNYSQMFLQVIHKVGALLAMTAVCVVHFLLLMSIPYFLLLALGNTAPSPALMWDVITLNAYTLFASSIVPTPGNSGAIELAYSLVFSPIPMGDGALFWVVTMWRTLTYYIYIIIGAVEMLALLVRRATRSRQHRQLP